MSAEPEALALGTGAGDARPAAQLEDGNVDHSLQPMTSSDVRVVLAPFEAFQVSKSRVSASACH
jgi:hypothetical protein